MTITRRSVALVLGAAVALSTAGCGAGLGFSASPNSTVSASASVTSSPTTSPTLSPTVQPTLSEKEAVTAEAQEMVRQMVVNFKGVTTIPKECLNATFPVDLTTPEFYRTRGGKESAGAFGPSIGTSPCAISKNRVERYIRDSSLLVTKANEIAAIDKKSGIKAIKSTDVARKVVQLHNGPYQDRLELARKVTGWYSTPSRELSIVKKDGVYTSNTMRGDGTTATSYGNKPSDVVETRDTKTGDVVKGDRINCGDQAFKPGIPPGFQPPPPGKEVPNLKKKISDHPVNNGNGPPVRWNPAPPINEETEPATRPGGGTPPPVYVPPAPPKPKPTPRPEPTPEPPPTSVPVPSGTPTCNPDICGD